MRKPTEFEIEQQVLLGGRISGEHPEFKQWAMYDPDIAFIIEILKKMPTFEKMTSEESLIFILESYAKLEFLKNTTEITKLSMIMGDQSKGIDMRKALDKLRGITTE